MSTTGAEGLRRGATLGRYVVLERVGEGASAVVYAAYDPTLDRRVALKLLKRGEDEATWPERRRRLLREAQAMARLSHPNVVPVFEAGEADGHVFIAMEFVRGRTLRAWLAERPRSWREVLDLFRDAGSGLAAAHAAGLVHRDFKPENVLVDGEGRARVTDFGLARAGEPSASPAPGEAPPASLTQTGAVLGTPAYMAPEQVAGRATDHRTDQFAFCVALYEALHGERPFAGDTFAEVAFAVSMGTVRPPPREARVPAWLRGVLVKGLSPSPEDRHASMGALLAALGRDPARLRRRVGLALGALAVAALVGGVAADRYASARQRCRGAEALLAGAWDEGRRGEVRRAFLATGLPYAEDAAASVGRVLDRFAGEWASTRVEACEATEVRREQSPRLLDLRMACLHQRLVELRSLVDLLARSDPEVVEGSVRGASALTPVGTCSDAAALLDVTAPPSEGAARAEVEAVQAEVARVKALVDTGKFAEAAEAGEPLPARARAAGHRPTEAEAWLALGMARLRLEQFKPAESAFEAALLSALAGRDRRATAWALTRMITVVNAAEPRTEEGLVWSARAQAAIEAIGGDPTIEATRLCNVGLLLADAGRLADGAVAQEACLDLRVRTFGEDHFEVGAAANNLASTRYAQGDYATALALYGRAADVFERTIGALHPYVALSLDNRGAVLAELGRNEEALEMHRRTLAMREKVLGPDHPHVGNSLTNLGVALARVGKVDEALRAHEQALHVYEGALGPDDPMVGTALINLGTAQLHAGRARAALPALHRAVAVFERSRGPDHPDVAEARLAEGEALLRLDRPADAAATLSRGWSVARSSELAPFKTGQIAEALAHALWDSGEDRLRARAMAREARKLYAQVGEPAARDLARLDDWIASPRSTPLPAR
jgi:tetratricopeptide (TPR) repeat protein/tRNA A-37 threonylcarbamoyl transferase component Bud32